jgi:16S rRNA C967 or C1407 C5-methylase (RsmB/RsmF family)/NOL1/NOP2/fmu family ribosome biogenesis protein
LEEDKTSDQLNSGYLWFYSIKNSVMQLPETFLNSLQNVEGFNREAFEKVHQEGEQVTSIRINPAKWSIVNCQLSMGETHNYNLSKDSSQQSDATIHHSPFTIHYPVPWSQYGYYLEKRPSFTFDPLFHAGCYYVQEASSMFLEQALQQLLDLSRPLKILDLSAAPGGKSTHIQSLISKESLLVSNEVIRSRCAILTDNIIKWGSSNVMVTNNDPAAFKKLTGYFDVIVVDAPCSGSGLFRKDEGAISEWSLNNVALCSQRQQRILADVLPALKQNGLLIYSTCSYSKEEDEDIGDWLTEEFKMQNAKLKMEKEWGIVESESPKTNAAGYRFYPDKLKGEGFFISCFRKTAEEKEARAKPAKLEKASAKEKAIIQPWLKEEELELIKENNSFSALPVQFTNEYALLRSVVNIQYKGTGIGQIMKDKLVPDHSLALSTILSYNIATTELSYEDAIKYLQRQDLNLTPSAPGWQTVNYQNHILGWINALPNRINNYYPKEMRILKRQNDAAFEK